MPQISKRHPQISIHTFLAEGDVYSAILATPYQISIHTFLAEGDKDSEAYADGSINFNPHLPRGR